jgi:CRISPR-associated endonuclease/helicase Cas3
MGLSDPIRGFWGKSDRNDPSRTHPLLAHSADVAAVMEALLALPIYRRVFKATCGAELDSTTSARFAVLAGLHDMGKTTAGFQAKNLRKSRTHGHILPMGALCDNGFRKSFQEIFPWLFEWGESTSDYLTCMCGHHGSYPETIDEACRSDVMAARRVDLWNEKLPSGLYPFDGLRSLAAHFRIWFPDAFCKSAPSLPEMAPVQHLFAGLLIMADWIGSDEQFFPFADPEETLENYIETARERAKLALRTMWIDVGKQRTKFRFPKTFSEQFQYEPLPIQKIMDDMKLDSGGSLVILEAETGSGKTECALRHFLRLFEAGMVDSLYFANPLRFAATQLQKRVAQNMGVVFGEGKMPTVLAVPGYLVVDDRKGVRLPGYSVLWEDEQDARRNWAAEHPKRYMCAPCAVGTIDQALLAVLKAPHAHLRAAALARSLLVIDEVHASDHFMARIIESLVELFALSGGHVLMMSATLGGAVRERFLHVYRSRNAVGRSPVPEENKCIEAPYPLISSTVSDSTVPSLTGRSKAVAIELRPEMTSPEMTATVAIEAANAGACVLLLRNSVASAIETLKALEKQSLKEKGLIFSIEGIPTLHHARFAPVDRARLDQEVEYIFGKYGEGRRPCIIVATQTLEQSLDVDFDLLITDLCPSDVLLQRIGRLFRHNRVRPPAFASPRCIVLVPDEGKEWLLKPDAHRRQFGRERAYEDLRSVAATWELLEERINDDGILHIPGMNRYFVEKATHPSSLANLAKRLGPEWEKITVEVAGGTGAQRQQAAFDIISWRKEYKAEFVSPVDDRRITTRLGLDDARVLFLNPLPGPFSLPIDKITIPGWMLQGRDFSELDEGVKATLSESGFGFSVCGESFVYSRYGLERS